MCGATAQDSLLQSGAPAILLRHLGSAEPATGSAELACPTACQRRAYAASLLAVSTIRGWGCIPLVNDTVLCPAWGPMVMFSATAVCSGGAR